MSWILSRNLTPSSSRNSWGPPTASQTLPGDKPKPLARTHSKAMVDPIFDYQFRLILIGDTLVGKSSLLKYFTDGTFAEMSDPTVGVDFFARLVRVSDGTHIKLQLWDTAGQERFKSITKSYYRNTVGVLVVYDISNRESFDHIPQWMLEAKRHIEPRKAVFILVGCKADLGDPESSEQQREVSKEEATLFAQSRNMSFFETSAKLGYNVDETFQEVAQQIYDKIKSGHYHLEDGWDGIKRGFFNHSNHLSSPGHSVRNSSVSNNSVSRLLEGTPVQSKCC